MKLVELAVEYQAQSDALKARLRVLEELRGKGGGGPELARRIRLLDTMRRETAALAKLCANYYERGYCRSERYTVRGIRRVKRTAV